MRSSPFALAVVTPGPQSSLWLQAGTGVIRCVTALGPRRHAQAAAAVEPGDGVNERTGREDRPMPGPGGLPSQPPVQIIGRDGGLARLRGLVDPVPAASQVLLVTGEAGMGKTMLLADLAGRAR